MKITPQQIHQLNNILRSIDPRLTPQQRNTALQQTTTHPELTITTLTQTIHQYHQQAETLAGLPPGTLTDRLRQQLHAHLNPDDILTHTITQTHPETPPTPEQPTPIAAYAENAEQQRRHRQQTQHHTTAGLVPATLTQLANQLHQQRATENAINQADPDNPATMPTPTQLAQALTEPDPTRNPQVKPHTRTYQPPPTTASNGGNTPPGTTPALCGHPLTSGPCVLLAGHVELPVPGTEAGHVSDTMRGTIR